MVKKVLCLDGFGTRSLCQIEILIQINKRLQEERVKQGKPIRNLNEEFDLIVGASSGALLACVIGVLNHPLEDTRGNFNRFFSRIYSKNWYGYKKIIRDYTPLPLLIDFTSEYVSLPNYINEQLSGCYSNFQLGSELNIYFKDRKLSDITNPKIALISCRHSIYPEIYLFTNYKHDHITPLDYASSTNNIHICDAIHATMASPPYFKALELQIDGKTEKFVDSGLLYENPIQIATYEAQKLWPNEKLVILSIGSGLTSSNNSELFLHNGISNQISSSVDGIHNEFKDYVTTNVGRLYRFQPIGTADMAFDCTDLKQQKRAIELTSKYLSNSEISDKINQLVADLIE